MKLFTGSITYYNEDAASPYITDHFIVCGDSFGETTDQICDYYGVKNVESVTLTLINYDSPIVCFEDDEVTSLVETKGVVY